MSLPSTIDLNDYSLISKVGEGNFAEVFTIKHKESGNIYAAKIFLRELQEDFKNELHNLSREVNILYKIKYPSIVTFIGFSPKNFFGEFKPVIVTEYMPNGTLYDILFKNFSLINNVWNSTKKLITIYGISFIMI